MKSLVTIIIIFIQVQIFAQGGHRPNGGEKIRAMKVGLITEELNLSESQAEKFWPVYNAYSDERMAIHHQIRELTRRNNGLSNDELLNRQDEIMDLRQKELNVVKKYRESFLRIISPKQYSDMMESERKFNDMILQKLKERHERN